MSSTTNPVASSAFHVLLALADRERYGLGIVEEIERRTGGDVRLGPGTLYNTIKKLRDAAWIEEVVGPDAHPGADPRRRYYRLTAAGRETLAREAERLEQLVEAARAKRLLAARDA